MDHDTDALAPRHLAKIIESSDDAIVSKDLNGIILSWNAAAERMFGYTAAEAIGHSIRIIIPDVRQSEEDFVLGEIRAGKSVQHYETVRQRKDGTLIPISLTVSPIHNEQGVVIGASKIARDNTERAQLLAMAQEQAATLKTLSGIAVTLAASLDRGAIAQQVADAATAAIHAEFGAFFYNVVDATSGDTYMLYALSGVPKEAVDGLPKPGATAVFAPTFGGEGVVRLADLSQDARFSHNFPFHGLPPRHLPVRSYLAVPVKAASGEVLGGLFFGHAQPDVFTEQHEELAVGIASWASVALENARLYRQARDADRVKDEFLAVLSHELRTPLNAIVGYSRLLRGGLLSDDKATRGLEALERNANSLTQIVEDVLDISRIESGKIRLDVQPVELPLIVHNGVATMQPAADAKGIRIQTIMDPSVRPVSGDPNRLQQVIWNLLSNAVKFTPKGGRIQVRVERVNSHVDVVVSDTGIGIRREFLPHVFERFRQGNAGSTRQSAGLGLGLSIVRHIVELHGGSVDAASDGEGQGATFRVRLPVMIVQDAVPREPREHPRTETMVPLKGLRSLAGIRVMAIDDEADALGLLRVVLEAAGAQVVTMSSPQDALHWLAEAKPDVMVVDLGMPRMDGFEFIKRVRASDDAAIRDIPAAALTAFARSEDRTRALDAGFEMHLAKPVEPGELVASVATLVRRRPGSRKTAK